MESCFLNVEGKGEVFLCDCLKNVLWMWFDCIIVGEICGEEVIDMLQVMNIGYDGFMIIIYVNFVCDGVSCLENMIVMVGIEMLIKVVCFQIFLVVNLIVQVLCL